MNKELADMRENYKKGILDKAHTDQSPLVQFQHWFDEAVASAIPEPNAMILATASAQGKPSARTVLLKGIDEAGFIFFTNYNSRKGREIAENPQASLLFFWGELQRQVRIDGHLEKISSAENDEYFYSRPFESQIGAMASPQSQVIESRKWLEQRMEDLLLQKKSERPAHWGGYQLQPSEIEFWQGRPNRLHDRIQYFQEAGVWMRRRLAP
jgi:pyridoxamine 5'-phosphate oxidase